MPRKHVPRPGARTYGNYKQETLTAALTAVKEERMSIRKASVFYKIPFGTLFNKHNSLHMKKVGTPTVLTSAQEEELSEVIKIAGDWGYPLQPVNVASLVKEFLDHNQIQSKFTDNRPGPDWIKSFMKRNNLTARSTQNIKRARAKVSPEIVNDYFDNMTTTLRDVPKENIINYDETNFTDDPESKKVIVRRGQKHVEDVLDHSKSSYSVMFAGTADGQMLPPYVVYAAAHLYPTWIEGGPKGTRYNRTKSGWFESMTFEDWFMTIALPYCKKLPNDKPRVIIGDNVASHMSLRVIKACLENNVKFVMLPPNSTHLCQPLDVAYFGPLKKAWKRTLAAWKKKNKGCVPKHMFPRLLKQTLKSIEDTSAANMKAGFEATGIYPLDRNAVLKRIPGGNVEPKTNSSFSEELLLILKEERFGKTAERQIPKKRRLVDVQPGASVSEDQLVMIQKEKETEKENMDARKIKKEPSEPTTKKRPLEVTRPKNGALKIKQEPSEPTTKKQRLEVTRPKNGARKIKQEPSEPTTKKQRLEVRPQKRVTKALSTKVRI